MCIVKEIRKFVKNGSSVFREASKGQYNVQSEEVRAIKRELLKKQTSSFVDDKRNLVKDRQNVSKDIRKSFERLVPHG